MDIFTDLTVMKIRSLGIVMGLLFHSMVTNGYNMKSMENSGEKLFQNSFFKKKKKAPTLFSTDLDMIYIVLNHFMRKAIRCYYGRCK